MKLDPDQMTFVEQVGRFWEAGTGSRTAGRILGWLMISDPPAQSSADLVAMLGVSAGSVSTQIRHLEQLRLVERITFAGDRARYYQLRPHAWSRLVEEELNRIVEMRKLAEAATNVLPVTRPDRVSEMETVAGFLIDEWPALLDRLGRRLSEGTS